MILWGWFLLPLSSFFVAEIIMALLYAYLYFVLKVKKSFYLTSANTFNQFNYYNYSKTYIFAVTCVVIVP